MLPRLMADAVLVAHAVFIGFVLLGGLGALRWRWWPWLHGPALAWGVFIELSGRRCPLTGIENDLRLRAGDSGYGSSFIEQYLWPLIYPDGLTRPAQWVLAAVALGINAWVYAAVWRRWQRWRRPGLSRRPPWP